MKTNDLLKTEGGGDAALGAADGTCVICGDWAPKGHKTCSNMCRSALSSRNMAGNRRAGSVGGRRKKMAADAHRDSKICLQCGAEFRRGFLGSQDWKTKRFCSLNCAADKRHAAARGKGGAA